MLFSAVSSFSRSASSRGNDQEAGLRAPIRKRSRRRGGRDHHDRKMAERAARSQPILPVDRTFHPQRLFAAARQDPLQQRGLRQLPADQRVDMGKARQHRAVDVEHGDCRSFAERERREEQFIIDRVDAARHHPEQGAVTRVQAVGDDGGPAAVDIASRRLDRDRRGVGVGFEFLEIAPLGDADVADRVRSRPVEQVAVGIEDRDIADIGKRRDLGAQHQMRIHRRHLLPERFRRRCACDLHLRDQLGGDGLGILELLIEMAGQQHNGVLQLALGIVDGAFAEFVHHDDGADEDRDDEQRAAECEPRDRPTANAQQLREPAREAAGCPAPDVGNHTAHSRHSEAECIRCRNGITR